MKRKPATFFSETWSFFFLKWMSCPLSTLLSEVTQNHIKKLPWRWKCMERKSSKSMPYGFSISESILRLRHPWTNIKHDPTKVSSQPYPHATHLAAFVNLWFSLYIMYQKLRTVTNQKKVCTLSCKRES